MDAGLVLTPAGTPKAPLRPRLVLAMSVAGPPTRQALEFPRCEA